MNMELKLIEKETYIAPDIEVMEVEIEQSILADASGGGDLPGFGGEPW